MSPTRTIASPRTKLPLSDVTAWLIPGTGDAYVTGREAAVARFPAASTADTEIVFVPEAREIVTLHDPSAAGWTATPFTMTVALVSSTVPDTTTEAWSTVAPSAGLVTVTTGAVASGAGPTSIVRTTCALLPAVTVAPGSVVPETGVSAVPVSPSLGLVTDRLGAIVSTVKLQVLDAEKPAPSRIVNTTVCVPSLNPNGKDQSKVVSLNVAKKEKSVPSTRIVADTMPAEISGST